MKNKITIICDSREQKPYEFKGSIRQKLEVGDYSCMGYESEICVERKTKEDIYQSLGQGRMRFETECEKMQEYKYSAIVIESTLKGLLTAPKFTQMNPKVIIASLISWSIKYDIHIFFANNRKLARALTCRILEKYVRNKEKKNG